MSKITINESYDSNGINFFGVTVDGDEGCTDIFESLIVHIESTTEFKCSNCPSEWDEDLAEDSFSCDQGTYKTKREAIKVLRAAIKKF